MFAIRGQNALAEGLLSAWDDRVLAAMKEANVALIPTLKLWRYEARHERTSLAERFVQTGVEQLRAWHNAGGTVLFGTDVGYMSEYDPSEEYPLMAEAGMTFRQILAALTAAPAERFGASAELGRIAPGFLADLTVLRDSPADDVRAFTTVQYTIRVGNVIYRASGRRKPAQPPKEENADRWEGGHALE